MVKFIEDEQVGHEYIKDRPALVIENNRQIQITTVVTVMPMTSSNNKHKDDILVVKDEKNRLRTDSLIKVHHVISFDKSRFVHRIGEVNKSIMDEITEYLKKHFDL